MNSIPFKKRKQRINKKIAESIKIELQNSPTYVLELPEYKKFLKNLNESKREQIQKAEILKEIELKSAKDWQEAKKKQAWDEYHFNKTKLRSDLVKSVQEKITILKQEMSKMNKDSNIESLNDLSDCEDWIPSNRLNIISSFVNSATNEEIDFDFIQASTPNLIYSDYESKSTIDTIDQGSPSSQ